MTTTGEPEGAPTLGFLFRSLYSQLQAQVYGRMKEHGVSQIRPAFSPVFRYLGEKGMRLTDLAQSANMTKQSMAYLIDELAHLGWTESEPDPEDRRAKVVRWTREGQAVRALVIQTSKAVEAEWAEKVGGEDWVHTRSTLERLAVTLELV